VPLSGSEGSAPIVRKDGLVTLELHQDLQEACQDRLVLDDEYPRHVPVVGIVRRPSACLHGIETACPN
jgi:hypothetical protein